MKRCLSTRKRPDGLTRRRYLLEDGHRETTVEIPVGILGYFGPAKLAEAIQKHTRAEAVRKHRRRVDALILEGWKPAAISSETGMTETGVRKRRTKLIAAGKMK